MKVYSHKTSEIIKKEEEQKKKNKLCHYIKNLSSIKQKVIE